MKGKLMSQHRFTSQLNGVGITVLLGWDRPLKYFFLVIEKEMQAVPSGDSSELDDEDDDDGMIYSNLCQPNAFELSLEDFRTVLAEHGISVPESMFEQVEMDGRNNVGNRSVYYKADGSFHEV